MIRPGDEPCEMLPWDTAHFGFPVARVRGDRLTPVLAAAVDRWCARSKVRCLYFRARADDPETEQHSAAAGYRLVDVRLDFGYRIPPVSDGESQALPAEGARAASAGDATALEMIAREAYRLTRFYFDDNFPPDRVSDLYGTWVRRSLEGYADAVLVTGAPGRASGLVTCHLPTDDESGRIGLVGVESHHQGKGIGRALVLAALEWFRRSGVARVEVATQARNVDAQRLYQRCGFVTSRSTTWHHKWYP